MIRVAGDRRTAETAFWPVSARLAMILLQDLLGALRVVGAFCTVTDLGQFDVIGARTESGVSEPLVASTALPSVAPLYFLEGTDSSVRDHP
jgi:hypothetical protein